MSPLAIKLGIILVTGANAGFVLYIPAVALAAWYRGLLAGVLATLLGALADSLLFVPALHVLPGDIGDFQLRLLAYSPAASRSRTSPTGCVSERDRPATNPWSEVQPSSRQHRRARS